MPEDNANANPQTPPSTPAPPATPPGQPNLQYAGKYATVEALEQGFREIRKPLGLSELPADSKLFGDGGMFRDVKALESAYRDMDTLLSSRSKPAEKSAPSGDGLSIPPDDAKPDAPAPEPSEYDVPEIITKAGLKAEDLETTWAEKGDLTPEQYTAIRKAQPGLTNATIKAIARGMAAEAALHASKQAQIKTEATTIAGGQQQLDALLAFAKSEFSGPEKADLNRRLGDPALFKGAIQQIMAAHREKVGAGKAQPLINGGPGMGHSITSADDILKLRKRANAGDASALAALNAIPHQTYAQLMANAI